MYIAVAPSGTSDKIFDYDEQEGRIVSKFRFSGADLIIRDFDS